MMVPGRKLWDSSPAMVSQHKRFRRSRQNPKIARDQVCRNCRASAMDTDVSDGGKRGLAVGVGWTNATSRSESGRGFSY